jgi:hypothetical protein
VGQRASRPSPPGSPGVAVIGLACSERLRRGVQMVPHISRSHRWHG